MSETPSTMLDLGTKLPAFSLPNAIDGQTVGYPRAAEGKGVLVMFICNHCPYVKHIRAKLVDVAHGYLDKGLAVVAINSNSEKTHPQDGPVDMRKLATDERWGFPYLFDATQDVAKAYHAACTPDFFLFDREHRLIYRGEFDDARPGRATPVTGAALTAAVDKMLAGEPPLAKQRPSIGCNIKWNPGNEPGYFVR